MMQDKKILIENVETFLINNEKKLIYIPSKKYICEISATLMNKLYAEEEDAINYLRSYVKNKKIYDFMLREYPILVLPISMTCNLRCKYCYQGSNMNNGFDFNKITSIIDAYFDKFAKFFSNKDNVIFSFNGGYEPTCEMELLKYTVGYIQEKCKRINSTAMFIMTTNAYFTDEVKSFLMNNNFRLTISFDGNSEIMYHQRNVSNQYSIIVKNIKELKSIINSLRMTVTSFCLGKEKEIVESIYNNFGSVRLKCAKVDPIGSATLNNELVISNIEYIDFIKKLKTLAVGKIDVIIPNVKSKINLSAYSCGAASTLQWVVSPMGKITTCTRDIFDNKFNIGEFNFVDEEFIIDQNKRNRINKEKCAKNCEKCRDCFCKFTCAGGCHYTDGETMCEAIKEFTYFELVKKLNKEEI